MSRVVLGICLLLATSCPVWAEYQATTRSDSSADPAARHKRTIRTVQIDMGLIWFHPRFVTVSAGETVRFVLRNMTEEIPHEFTIGSPNMQRGRRELIEEMSQATPIETHIHNSSPYDAPNAVVVLPGETKELIWTFTDTQRFEFGCNIPGHYEFGMKGSFQLLTGVDNALDFPSAGSRPLETIASAVDKVAPVERSPAPNTTHARVQVAEPELPHESLPRGAATTGSIAMAKRERPVELSPFVAAPPDPVATAKPEQAAETSRYHEAPSDQVATTNQKPLPEDALSVAVLPDQVATTEPRPPSETLIRDGAADSLVPADTRPETEIKKNAPAPSGDPAPGVQTTAVTRVDETIHGDTPNNAPRSAAPNEEHTVEKAYLETLDAAQQLGAGHELMASGSVLKARELYTRSLEAGLSEAALALGRSYDPRAISRLDMPDAEPDLDQARKWYEEWYRRSVEQGTISPEIKLVWLLRAMDRQ